MPLVPNTNDISYNGFTFGPYTETVGIDVKQRYDSSGRTVVANVYSFNFRTIITNSGTTTDSLISAAVCALSKPGGRFKFVGRGMGDLSINIGKRRDAAWGPLPEVVSLRQRGKDNATELTWKLTVTVPDCCADVKYAFAFMEFNYSVDFQIDRGYTTRNVTGHLIIPQTRTGGAQGRQLSDTVDYYREKIVPPLLPGFDRKFGPFRIDEAKTRLDFSFTDTEFESASIPPPGIVEVSSSHSFSSSSPGLLHWTSTIDASYELPRDASGLLAVQAFFRLVKDRVGNLADAYRGVPANFFKGAKNPAKSIFPVSMNFAEPTIYGRRKANFSLTYSFVFPLEYLFAASGLWRKAPDSNWGLWANAIQDTALSPRGYAAMLLDTGSDRLIDLCDSMPGVIYGGDRTTDLPTGGPPIPRPGTPQTPKSPGPFETELKGCFPKPPAEASWVFYETELWLETESGTVSLTTLPQSPLSSTTDMMGRVADIAGRAWDAVKGPMPEASKGATATGLPRYPKAGDTSVQRRVRPTAFIFLRGRAARIGYPIEVPRLVKVAGQDAVPANRLDMGEGFSQGVKFAAGETAVYTARWNLRYSLNGPPLESLPIPTNPIMNPSGQ